MAGRLIGDAKRDVARILIIIKPKHGENCGCIGSNIRHHHNHLPRTEIRILIERRQQLIMQYLDLTQGAVGAMKHNRTIYVRIQSRPMGFRFIGRDQIQNIRLDLSQ